MRIFNKLVLTGLSLAAVSLSAHAENYKYTVKVNNNTSNVTLTVQDTSSTLPVNGATIPVGGQRTFMVNDDGNSFRLIAGPAYACTSNDSEVSYSMFDLSSEVEFYHHIGNHNPVFVADVTGQSYGGNYYSYNCIVMPEHNL